MFQRAVMELPLLETNVKPTALDTRRTSGNSEQKQHRTQNQLYWTHDGHRKTRHKSNPEHKPTVLDTRRTSENSTQKQHRTQTMKSCPRCGGIRSRPGRPASMHAQCLHVGVPSSQQCMRLLCPHAPCPATCRAPISCEQHY